MSSILPLGIGSTQMLRVFDNFTFLYVFYHRISYNEHCFLFYRFLFFVSILAIVFFLGLIISVDSWIMLILSLTFRLINESLTVIALRFIKVWCFLLWISANWFSKFIFLSFFSLYIVFKLLIYDYFIRSHPPSLFLSWLFIINLLGGTSWLFFDVRGGFLVSVSKLLHTGEELMLDLSFRYLKFKVTMVIR